MTPSELRSLILFESADTIVLNKPSGLLVHPVAPDSVALTNFLPGLDPDLRPAHRLDRDTSGCLVLGRGPEALRRLGKLFMRREIEKSYLALVDGVPGKAAGLINAPLLKKNARMVVDADGDEAITEWEVAKTFGEVSLLELRPKTGRTHQLRAHMAHLGHPIIGDSFYGGLEASRLMLHAYQVTLPGIGSITAPMPEAFIHYAASAAALAFSYASTEASQLNSASSSSRASWL